MRQQQVILRKFCKKGCIQLPGHETPMIWKTLGFPELHGPNFLKNMLLSTLRSLGIFAGTVSHFQGASLGKQN